MTIMTMTITITITMITMHAEGVVDEDEAFRLTRLVHDVSVLEQLSEELFAEIVELKEQQQLAEAATTQWGRLMRVTGQVGNDHPHFTLTSPSPYLTSPHSHLTPLHLTLPHHTTSHPHPSPPHPTLTTPHPISLHSTLTSPHLIQLASPHLTSPPWSRPLIH